MDFERGDSFGYGLFYRTQEKDVSLYNNAFLVEGSPGKMPGWYVAWNFDGTNFIGPVPTKEFAPLPTSGKLVRVFELPRRTYSHSAPPPNLDNPPFMNIFLNPQDLTQEEFNSLADCLNAHRDEINSTLAAIGSKLPVNDRSFYHPLRLGGLVYGPPPYKDKAYLQSIRSLWGENQDESILPAYGPFTVYPGRTAKGTIAQRSVAVSVGASGQPELTVDGKRSERWQIGEGICGENLENCEKRIDFIARRNDGSLYFIVFVSIGKNAFAMSPLKENVLH
jgi:hypothetical protein